MKRLVRTICFALILSLSGSPLAYAQWTVIDPTNLGQNTVTAGASTVSAGANTVTSAQTYLNTFNQMILKPIATVTTLAVIFQNSKNITQLIIGSDSLLVRDPELYLKNKALAVVQGGVDDITAQNGIFGNSILNVVIGGSKSNSSSLTIKLAAINHSTLPALQQAKICNNDSALSALVKSSTALSGADYTARKQELYDTLCRGNPDTDPVLAKKLFALSNQNPSLDAFYAITQGDNAYTKALLAQEAIRKDAEARQAQAKADLAAGGGIRSKTTCTKTASNGGCLQQTIDQAGSILNAAFNDAQTTISKTARGLLEPGSLVGTALTTVGLLAAITSSVKSLTSDSSSGGGSGSATLTVGQTGANGGLGGSAPTNTTTSTNGGLGGSAPTNTTTSTTANTVVTSTTGFTQDLANDPQTKAMLSGAPVDQLNYHKEALVKLETTDTDYLNTVGAYNAQLASMKACFDNLKTDFPDETATSTQYDARIAPAITFASTTKASNDELKLTLTAELSKIATTSLLISNTITKIQGSNSTEEISKTFQTYQDRVKAENLPNVFSGMSRDGDRVLYESKLQQDTAMSGRIYNFNKDCGAIRDEINRARALQGAGA